MLCSSSEKVPGKVIIAGYVWVMRVKVATGAFTATSKFRAQVRRSPDVDDVLHELTTANGGVKRVDETTLELMIPGGVTANWPARTAFIDIARTDLSEPTHLGFRLAVPVQKPITRA